MNIDLRAQVRFLRAARIFESARTFKLIARRHGTRRIRNSKEAREKLRQRKGPKVLLPRSFPCLRILPSLPPSRSLCRFLLNLSLRPRDGTRSFPPSPPPPPRFPRAVRQNSITRDIKAASLRLAVPPPRTFPSSAGQGAASKRRERRRLGCPPRGFDSLASSRIAGAIDSICSPR